jgi:hypothetical protein
MKIRIASILFAIMSYNAFMRSLRLDITFGSTIFVNTIDFKPVYISYFSSEESFDPVSEWSLLNNRASKLVNGTGQITINSKLSTSDSYDYNKVTYSFANGKVSTSAVWIPLSCSFSSKVTLKIDEIIFFNRIFNVYVSVSCGSSIKSESPMKAGLVSTNSLESVINAQEVLKTIMPDNKKSNLLKINNNNRKTGENRTRRSFAFVRNVDTQSTESHISKLKQPYKVKSSLKQFNPSMERVYEQQSSRSEVNIDQVE